MNTTATKTFKDSKAALANAKKLLDISMIPRWTRIGSDMVDR